jgi:hypothetical protein
LRSMPGKGSTFTLYLPLKYAGPPQTAQVAQRPAALPVSPSITGCRSARRAIARRPGRSGAGRHGPPHRRGRRALWPYPRRSGARQRLQGAGGVDRR